MELILDETAMGRKKASDKNPQPENSSLNEGGHAFGGLDVNEIVWGYIDEHEDEIVAENKSRQIDAEYDDCFYGADWGDGEDVAERYEDWATRWHWDDYDELMALPLPKDGAECKARMADYVKYDIHQDETVFDTYAEEALEKYDVLYEDAVADFENRMREFFDDPDSPLRKAYPNVGFSYDEGSSRSWNAGRWPSVYFTIAITPLDDADADWDGEEFDVRLSDGHPNGQGADDYEIEWQGYRGNEDAFWKGFVEEFVNWLGEELDDMHNNDDAYGLLAENLDERVGSSAGEGKLNESRELSKGVFWIKDPDNPNDELTFPIPSGLDGETLDSSSVIASGMADSGMTYNHRRIWDALPDGMTDGKPFDYYPRGRVEIRNGKARIFANPLLGNDACMRVIENAFGLNGAGLDSVEFISDGSDHYKSHFDSGYSGTNGKGKGRKHRK